jgi:ComF family protein
MPAHSPLRHDLHTGTLIVPIPTAISRIRQRGYDQTVLLARALSRQGHLLRADVLVRVSRSRQVGANRQKRLAQLRNSFIVSGNELVRKADILLIDDVVTTGATLETAATVLKKAGAKSVSAVVFAQKQ